MKFVLPVLLAIGLVYSGWWINGTRLDGKIAREQYLAADARAQALMKTIDVAQVALGTATNTLKQASHDYELAHADLDQYRANLGSRYGNVRLCTPARATTAGAHVQPATGGAGSAPGDSGPRALQPLSATVGPDLGALAADAEQLRQRAMLCRTYAETIAQWAHDAKLTGPAR